MKFHGMDIQGYFKSQIIVDASALVWNAVDERRVVYDETTGDLWIADDVEWRPAGSFSSIPDGTEMWFYADSAPAGWEIVSGTDINDELVAVKSNAGTYTTGGTTGGSNFTLPAHSHLMNDHRHNASGTANISTAERFEKEGDSGRAHRSHTHNLVLSVASPSPTSTGSGGNMDYRPYSRVGIICRRGI